ncbi:anti-sigma factor family protein [Pseudomonas citronellolis]|uniref:anti-sigma factor family protein n=1 Tax=Pseudomonas citronellolis TaxID=53408 RepID=UPI0023E3CCEA|nr:transcriptional regulator [Pseudomonas citronellolis]MDF3935801.1 transcriptional regulator [Pseudomonas citronellolis]
MNEQGGMARVSDETLVAFIDGELDAEQAREVEARIAADAELAQRLDSLCSGCRGLDEAFDALLAQAPVERLGASLAPATRPQASSQRSGVKRRWLAFAAAACLVLGMGADRLLLGALGGHHDEEASWRQRVADYMSLYTVQTLDHLSVEDSLRQAQLTSVGARLGLALPAADLQLDGASLRRAQILEYDGVPIAQLTYLDERYGPMALCITRGDGKPSALEQERREGMNLVYWKDAGHAYLLIGHQPPQDLQSMAAGLRERLGSGGGV